MLKLLIKIFSVLIPAVIILAALYIFDLPPFNKVTPTPSTQNQLITEETKNLPAELQENKIGRNKSFQEMIDRAAALEKAGFPTLAIAQYQEAANKNPNSQDPILAIGKIYLRTENYTKAEEVFTQLSKATPTQDEYKILLTRALIGQRKATEAKKVIDQISTPTQSSTFYQGMLAAFFSDHDNAKKDFNQSIKLGQNNGLEDLTKKANNFLSAYNEYQYNSESSTVHLKTLLARSFVQCGEYQLAIPLLFEVHKAKADYRDAWVLLGYAYLETSKYQDAVEALERAKVLDKEKPETLFYLGLAYFSLNKFPEAAQNLEAAKTAGFSPVILVDQKLAETYLQMKEYSKSAAAYEMLLGQNSDDINYFIRPIWIYLEKTNQVSKAITLAQKALDLHPESAMSHNLLGWTLIYNKNFSEAEKELKLAIKINPNLDAAYLNYGLLFEKQNQNEKALTFYKKAHQLGQGNNIALAAADRYNNLVAQSKSASAINSSNFGQANLIAPK